MLCLVICRCTEINGIEIPLKLAGSSGRWGIHCTHMYSVPLQFSTTNNYWYESQAKDPGNYLLSIYQLHFPGPHCERQRRSGRDCDVALSEKEESKLSIYNVLEELDGKGWMEKK